MNAEQTAETWRKGPADWDEDGARNRRLTDAAVMVIYTPGSSAGLPLTAGGLALHLADPDAVRTTPKKTVA